MYFFWNTVSQWIWSLTIDQAGWPEGSRYLLISMCSNVGNIGACRYPSFSYGCWWSKLGFSCLRRKLFIDLAISPAPNTCIFSHLLLCVVKVSLEHCFGIWAVLEYLGKMNCLHTNGINYLPTSVVSTNIITDPCQHLTLSELWTSMNLMDSLPL